MLVIDSSVDVNIKELCKYIILMSNIDDSFVSRVLNNLTFNKTNLEAAKKILKDKQED